MRQKALAWSVHVFTASGAVLALLAVIAIDGHRWTEAMLWLFAALVVDGVDGTFARAARTPELAGRVDGNVLDLVIDYLNYVFVPTLLLLESGILQPPFALPLAALIQVSSLYVFARRDMKTADGYFRGFPALWNIVALYLYATGIAGVTAAIIVAALIALTFAPVLVVHPFRVRNFGLALPALAILWAASTLAMLVPAIDGQVRAGLLVASGVSALAMIALGLVRSFGAPRDEAPADI